jgi:hypothetical protein
MQLCCTAAQPFVPGSIPVELAMLATALLCMGRAVFSYSIVAITAIQKTVLYDQYCLAPLL